MRPGQIVTRLGGKQRYFSGENGGGDAFRQLLLRLQAGFIFQKQGAAGGLRREFGSSAAHAEPAEQEIPKLSK